MIITIIIGSASAATDLCALISLSLSSTFNCYYCHVCLCSFAILCQYPCSVTNPSCNLVKCYQRGNIHIIIIIIITIIIIIIISIERSFMRLQNSNNQIVQRNWMPLSGKL